MAPNSKYQCKESDCFEDPYLGGYCKEHHEERSTAKELRDTAIRALHDFRIDGETPKFETARTELESIKKWWHRACDAVNYQCRDEVLQDEADFAVEWCIAIAQELVKEERKFRDGKLPTHPDSQGTFTKKVCWDRFKNLEQGLASNGRPRNG